MSSEASSSSPVASPGAESKIPAYYYSGPAKIIRFQADKQTPVKEVTVYNDRAETTRVIPFIAEAAGAYELIVDGLSEKIDKDSIHVKGGVGQATILEVSYHVNHQIEELPHNNDDHKKKDLEHLEEIREGYLEELSRVKKELEWVEAWAIKAQAQSLASLVSPVISVPIQPEVDKRVPLPRQQIVEEPDVDKRVPLPRQQIVEEPEVDKRVPLPREQVVEEPKHEEEPEVDKRVPLPRQQIVEEPEVDKRVPLPRQQVVVQDPSSLVPTVDLFSEKNLASTERFLEFYDKVLHRLDGRKFKVAKQLREIEQSIKVLSASLGAKVEPKVIEKREVTITIHVAEPGEVKLELSYIIFGASWLAAYDVRVNSENGKTQLTYYGVIRNNSNENWIDTQLSLSTASPSLGGSPPVLSTLYVNWKRPALDRSTSVKFSEDDEEEDEGKDSAKVKKEKKRTFSFGAPSGKEAKEKEAAKPTPAPLVTAPQEALTSTTFNIPRVTSILGDDKPHKVTIAVVDLQSTFTYTAAPKLSAHAFVKATTINESQYPLLEGPTNVFVDLNFVANSQLKRVSPGEDFELFLGTDSSVKLEYKPERKVSDTAGFMAKNATQHVKQETIIKNTKAVEITIFVYEQIPLSGDEKIKVKLVAPDLKQEADKVKLNSANNLEWKVTIPAKQEHKFPLEYLVEWPKDRAVEFK